MKRGPRDFPAPRGSHFGQWMFCKWCDGRIPEVIDGKRSRQRLWHPACADEFNLHTRLEDQRAFVIKRDGARCAACPDGTPEPARWIAGPVITVYRQSCFGYGRAGGEWADAFCDRPDKPWALWTDDDRLVGQHQEIRRASALELDHRVPLWSVAGLPDDERRWYFGPGNLWMLCPKHHKAKTAREAKQRAAERAFVKAQLPLL